MPHAQQRESLLQAWNQLMDVCGIAASQTRLHTFACLHAAYSESHRHYHNLDHVEHLLHGLDDIADRLCDPVSVRFAVWYHDVVYDPRSSANEANSAIVAERSLRELGIHELRVQRVADLILMTRDHLPPLTDEDEDGAYFLDADLEVLGWSAYAYQQYSEAIRREYAFVPDAEYRAGRQRVLQGLLDRPSIYHTDYNRTRLEAQARENIMAELFQLQHGGFA